MAAYEEASKERDELRYQLSIVKTKIQDVWFFQGDGHDYPESLTCPVIMSADKFREITK